MDCRTEAGARLGRNKAVTSCTVEIAIQFFKICTGLDYSWQSLHLLFLKNDGLITVRAARPCEGPRRTQKGPPVG
jgi:hypothetical protein